MTPPYFWNPTDQVATLCALAECVGNSLSELPMELHQNNSNFKAVKKNSATTPSGNQEDRPMVL
jgi:hypothetical protein